MIAGAHLGKGLGHDFLRHVLRTKILVHLVSGTSVSPVEDMIRVNEELALFDTALARKPQVVALNKIDLPEVQARLAEIRDALSSAGVSAFYISAATGQGVSELMAEVMRVLKKVAARGRKALEYQRRCFGLSRGRRASVSGKKAMNLSFRRPSWSVIKAGAGMSASELRWQLRSQLARLGVKKALEKAGVKPGDKIRCGSLEWEW